jgi:GTP-binding protein
MSEEKKAIRNVAIIAHVDHGKTTLVDELLKQSGTFRENQATEERMMDSNDIEKERGITILSKNTSVFYGDTRINIVDTPGHADFGGEVERVLKMVDGVVLVVDAFEGPMPQTKFVLKNALSLKLPVLICVNKVDRPEARPTEVVDEVLELFMELDATDEQLDSPVVYTSAKQGISFLEMGDEPDDMKHLFESILKHIPLPKGDPNADLQMLITTIDHNEYVGRLGIGKVENGTIRIADELVMVNMLEPDKIRKVKITKIYEYEGLGKIEVKEASVGAIIAIAGVEDIFIGDTICAASNPTPMEFNKISEPTLVMKFIVNDSPFAGTEGKFVTSRQLRDRLFKELNTDVSIRVEDTETPDAFKVSGRGELHLSILIENMRREGYEFQVSKPEVLFKEEDGKTIEPQEKVTIDVPEEFCGTVIEKLGKRKGEMNYMAPSNGGYTRLTFLIPARGLIGYRTEFMTDTKGNGILNAEFEGYIPYKGIIETRSQGSLVSFESGESVGFGLAKAQERGDLFIGAGEKVYAGMVVGRNAKQGDMEVNICRKKALTNMRSSGADDATRLITPINMSLEQSLEFIGDDELVEITPENLRIRKKILDSSARNRSKKKQQ